jgi:uncharacterized protein YebE (UPF0316 family)
MEAIVWVFVIFSLRVVNIALDTVRMLFVVRGERFLAAVIGFVETLLFLVAIGKVIQDLTNIPNVLAYCVGFAVGTWVGMVIEERLALGYVRMHVVSLQKAKEIASSLRGGGYGVTEMMGKGKEGSVGILEVVAKRRDVPSITRAVTGVDDEAFITTEETRSVYRGYIPGVR